MSFMALGIQGAETKDLRRCDAIRNAFETVDDILKKEFLQSRRKLLGGGKKRGLESKWDGDNRHWMAEVGQFLT